MAYNRYRELDRYRGELTRYSQFTFVTVFSHLEPREALSLAILVYST